MAKNKQEEAPKGSPAWMATFSDLMNLLLCFFVLLFSMSTVDAQKFEMVVASLQSSFSILPSGGTSVGEGQLISSGVSALEMFNDFFNSSSALPEGELEPEDEVQAGQNEITAEQAEQALQNEGLTESEQMSQQIEQLLESYGLKDSVEVEFTDQYALINLNGALLFEAGESVVREAAQPILEKISVILNNYSNNLIEVEGHTDNVPTSGGPYESNDVLSMYRALYVADYIRAHTNIDASHIKSSGRGEYAPIADNSTPEGRARNRRVEIKIYNSLNTKGIQ